MRESAFAWVCELDGCGHRWLAKSDVAPELCAKCRRRGWHKTKTTGELIREAGGGLDDRVREIVREELSRYNVPQRVTPHMHNVAEPEILPPAARPSLDSLRDICAGITTTQPLDRADLPPCDFTQYDGQTGETYRCGLLAHPAKVKHTRGLKV